MNLAKASFKRLFPDKNSEAYSFFLKYSDKFKPYNANVRFNKNSFKFNLSKRWKDVSSDIQIGLLQSLFLRVFKEKKSTTEIDLYNSFMKKVHITIPKTSKDEFLEESFHRVNQKYLDDAIELTNLKWHNSINKLGSYEYGSDTISISQVLKKFGSETIDYVMYHEMLHKKHKFNCKNGRSRHHTKEFREEERRFENWQEIEKNITKNLRKAKNSFLSKLGL